VVYNCEGSDIKRGSDLGNSEVSGGETHTQQMVTGRMYILSLFVCTFEVTTYTKLLLTIGSLKHGGFESIIYIGTGRRQYVSLQQEKKVGGCNC
jgi:hypothetical protein